MKVVLKGLFAVWLFSALISCRTENKKKESQTGKKPVSVTRSKKNIPVQTVWKCFKFEPASEDQNSFSVNYAREFSAFSFFRLQNDTLYAPDGQKTSLYAYSFPTKQRSYDVEGEFIQFFRPQSDSIQLLAALNTGDPLLPFVNLYRHKKELVLLDRGYFFFYRPAKRRIDAALEQGCPADTRNPWRFTRTYRCNSFSSCLKKFRSEFPFGAEHLTLNLLQKSGFDKWGNEYQLGAKKVTIYKPDPMGKIKIQIVQKGKRLYELVYGMEYLEEG